MIDFNNTKQLKYIILVCSIYAVFIVVGLIINFIQFYFNFDNPLLPRYLINYVAFPLYFIIPVFTTIIIYTFWCYRNDTFYKNFIIGILIFSVLYFLFQAQLYQYIQCFSPYHSTNLD